MRERRLDQERTPGAAAAEVAGNGIVRRVRAHPVEPVDAVDRDHVAVDLLVEQRDEHPADADTHVDVVEALVADVVDERDHAPAVAGVVVRRERRSAPAARPGSVPGGGHAEGCRLPRVDRAVELLNERLRLGIGDLDAIVVAAVARRELEPLRDAVVVARDPHLDVRPDRAEREVLHVQVVRPTVERRPEPSVAHDGGRCGGCAQRLEAKTGVRQRSELGRLQLLRASARRRPPPARPGGRTRIARRRRRRPRVRAPRAPAHVPRSDSAPSPHRHPSRDGTGRGQATRAEKLFVAVRPPELTVTATRLVLRFAVFGNPEGAARAAARDDRGLGCDPGASHRHPAGRRAALQRGAVTPCDGHELREQLAGGRPDRPRAAVPEHEARRRDLHVVGVAPAVRREVDADVRRSRARRPGRARSR